MRVRDMSHWLSENQSDSQLVEKSNAALLHTVDPACVRNHLMLELAGVSAADGDDAAVNVQLADDGHASFQLRPERLWGAAAQTQQANQDVLLWILVGQEGLPAAVGDVIPSNQLHLNARVSVSERGSTLFIYLFLHHTTIAGQ